MIADVPTEIQEAAHSVVLSTEVQERIKDQREIKLRHGIAVLARLYQLDPRKQWGLTNVEGQRLEMFKDILKRTYPLTANQLEVLIKPYRAHMEQLVSLGVPVLNHEAIESLRQERHAQAEQRRAAQPHLDIQKNAVLVGGIYMKEIIPELRASFETLWQERGISLECRWIGEQYEQWGLPDNSYWAFIVKGEKEVPLQVWNIIAKRFPASSSILSERAQTYASGHVARALAQEAQSQQQEDARKQAYLTLYNSIDEELHIGVEGWKKPYKHQIDAVLFALHRNRSLVADEVGLGKTLDALLTAKAFQNVHGTKTMVVTMLSVQGMWRAEAEACEVNAEVYTWAKFPQVAALASTAELFEYICHPRPTLDLEPFFLVADEAHFMQNIKSARTRYLLALVFHPSCRGVILLTGTPMPNGRPAGTYPLLLACKHPLVYAESARELSRLKAQYETTFCGKELKNIGRGRKIVTAEGATNLPAWHGFFVYKPEKRKENTTSCIIHRTRRSAGVELPPFYRQAMTVEVSPQAQQIFEHAVEEMWDAFEATVANTVQAYIEDYRERYQREPDEEDVQDREAQVRVAQAVVGYGIFRHAAALAKVESTVDLAVQILENSKVVIFTSFRDVAQSCATAIRQATGKKVAIISGDVVGAKRDQMVADFQQATGGIQAMICMTKAAGVGITLTSAHHMILIDRPWTPGDAEQAEGRCWRLTQQEPVISYWLQMPEYITKVDSKVDGLISRKALNIAVSLRGEPDAEEDQRVRATLKSNVEKLMRETVERIRAQKR